MTDFGRAGGWEGGGGALLMNIISAGFTTYIWRVDSPISQTLSLSTHRIHIVLTYMKLGPVMIRGTEEI